MTTIELILASTVGLGILCYILYLIPWTSEIFGLIFEIIAEVLSNIDFD